MSPAENAQNHCCRPGSDEGEHLIIINGDDDVEEECWWHTLALSAMDEDRISLWEFVHHLLHCHPQHLLMHDDKGFGGYYIFFIVHNNHMAVPLVSEYVDAGKYSTSGSSRCSRSSLRCRKVTFAWNQYPSSNIANKCDKSWPLATLWPFFEELSYISGQESTRVPQQCPL